MKLNDFGIMKLTYDESLKEKELFEESDIILKNNDFKYLSISSIINSKTYDFYQFQKSSLQIKENELLAGSGEQGILEYFENESLIEFPTRIYTKNQCYRTEEKYDILHQKEFLKMEQFIICSASQWGDEFNLMVENVKKLFNKYNIKHRIVEQSNDNSIHTIDIECWSEILNEWIETNSFLYFGNKQSKYFNINNGKCVTMCGTMIASPRILLTISN